LSHPPEYWAKLAALLSALSYTFNFLKGEHPLKPMPGHYLTARIDEVCEKAEQSLAATEEAR
jgi:hypothetical protein